MTRPRASQVALLRAIAQHGATFWPARQGAMNADVHGYEPGAALMERIERLEECGWVDYRETPNGRDHHVVLTRTGLAEIGGLPYTGWAQPPTGAPSRVHYFRDGASLCGRQRRVLDGEQRPDHDPEATLRAMAETCDGCLVRARKIGLT